MPRRSKGYSKTVVKKRGKWYGRLRITKPPGGEYYTHQARNKTHARQLTDELEQKYIVGGSEALNAETMTFAELADHYRKAKVTDPIYDGEIKVAGMQAKESAEKEIKALLEYWITSPIQKITHADIEQYKIEMLRRPVVWRWKDGEGKIHEKARQEPRKMSSVNHLLRRLRAIMNFAKRKKWLRSNPFNEGEPLVSEAAEIPRNRAEKSEELEKLLKACTGRRRYLRPIILIMADTALRLTEVKRLTRGELDFEAKVARVRARNTKGNQARIIPLSDRVIAELRIWCDLSVDDNAAIFRQGEYKAAWRSVKREAGITDDLQLRDLRGWGTGRIAKAIARAKLPPQYGMKATGHTQEKTYRRYLKTDDSVAQLIGEALENYDADSE